MHLAVSEKSQRGRKKKQIKAFTPVVVEVKTITVLALSFVKGMSKECRSAFRCGRGISTGDFLFPPSPP